jgi:hypothetical protein
MEKHGAMIERSILFDSIQDFPIFLVYLYEVNFLEGTCMCLLRLDD